VLLILVMHQAGRTLGRNAADAIAIDVSETVDSGSVLYKFPHISGYRYLVSDSPESSYFFLSNLEGLATSKKLGHLSNTTVSLSVCEELDGEIRVVPVELRVKPSRTIPALFGSIAENLPAGTPVRFFNGSLDKILSLFSSPLQLTLTTLDDKHRRRKSRPDFRLERDDDGHWDLVTGYILDYEAHRRHKLEASDARDSSVVLDIVIDVDNVNDNLPVFNQTRYRFVLPPEVRRFSSAGKVFSTDADGDEVIFSFAKTYPCCVITPQTGDVIVVDIPTFPTELKVFAHEKESRDR
jgi:hypothetical protein